MSDKIRILYLIDHLEELGGTERHLVYLATMLDRARFDVTVVAFHMVENELAADLRAGGVEVLHIPVGRQYTPHAFVQALAIFRLIKRKRINLVQTYHYKADTYGTLIARLAGVRTVIASKRDAGQLKSGFNFFLNRCAQPFIRRYISVSDEITNVIVQREGAAARKVIKIHNGVDLRRFHVTGPDERTRARVLLGIPADAQVIGQAAWFREEKDHESLFKAFAQVRDRRPRAHLLLLGGGPLLEHCKQRAQQLAIGGSVTFAGVVSDVVPYLQAMDIGCLTPKGNEGFSNAIVEKMATGLPMVVTDVGGNKEAVTDAYNGFVVAPTDVSAIATRFAQLIDDESLRLAMGEASRRRVLEEFELGVMVRRHAELYESSISGN
ncbi:MAG TPA: glycosyltransferase [Vicinamibacterales bacterium]|nr:glycosyltransferase [Vicinamibacterales bacterium]